MPAIDRDYWTKELREAEAELAAAKRRTELNAAAKRLQRAKTELKRLEAAVAERPKRRPNPGSRSAGASS
jgi:multidrug resistance efflux pump